MKYFYLDLETTGVRHWKNGIHQISGAIEIDGEIKESFDFRVQPNPKCIIETEALKTSNVTEAQIIAYEPMNKVYNCIIEMLAKYVDKFNKTDKFFLIGYNVASFDNQFFRAFFIQNSATTKDAEYGNYYGSWFWSNTIDVMVLASENLKEIRHTMKDFKLKTVATTLCIPVDERKLHDAVYDIFLTREIYNLVKK